MIIEKSLIPHYENLTMPLLECTQDEYEFVRACVMFYCTYLKDSDIKLGKVTLEPHNIFGTMSSYRRYYMICFYDNYEILRFRKQVVDEEISYYEPIFDRKSLSRYTLSKESIDFYYSTSKECLMALAEMILNETNIVITKEIPLEKEDTEFTKLMTEMIKNAYLTSK